MQQSLKKKILKSNFKNFWQGQFTGYFKFRTEVYKKIGMLAGTKMLAFCETN